MHDVNQINGSDVHASIDISVEGNYYKSYKILKLLKIMTNLDNIYKLWTLSITI